MRHAGLENCRQPTTTRRGRDANTKVAQVSAERDRVPEVVVASHQLPEQQPLGGLAHQLDIQRIDIAHAADQREPRLPRRRSGNAGDRTDRAAPALGRQHQRTIRVEPLEELPALPGLQPPFGRRHRNSSHTVRASSIRLRPEHSRTISRISVTSGTLNARPENLVVATVVTAASPFPRHRSKTPRECPGERAGEDRPERAGAVITSGGCPKRGGWRRWPDAVPAQTHQRGSVRRSKPL